jgi:hypothetical protein
MIVFAFGGFERLEKKRSPYYAANSDGNTSCTPGGSTLSPILRRNFFV